MRSIPGSTGWALVTGADCRMAVVVDDRVTTWDDVNDLAPSQVLAVEVYPRAAAVPGRFQAHLAVSRVGDRNGCGIAIVWTVAAR
jgi:hypothetical protein